MKERNFSTSGLTAGMAAAALALTALFFWGLGERWGIWMVRALFLAYGLAMTGLSLAYFLLLRRRVVRFAREVGEAVDGMLQGTGLPALREDRDTLDGRIRHRLRRLDEAMGEARRHAQEEQAELQRLVSDISHQVKTPIANLKIINATLLEREMDRERQKEFLRAVDGQLDKLDFLMQSMIKTSRLETGAVALSPRLCLLCDTVAAALGGILAPAERKDIDVKVECPGGLSLRHDPKWTAEALFNLLDNAVKYTPAGGAVGLRAEQWEMYTRIDVSDTGRGIPEAVQGRIFERFYREEAVHDVEGVGVGLYLARQIVTRQGGYIQVRSALGEGSVFSVYLPNR